MPCSYEFCHVPEKPIGEGHHQSCLTAQAQMFHIIMLMRRMRWGIGSVIILDEM